MRHARRVRSPLRMGVYTHYRDMPVSQRGLTAGRGLLIGSDRSEVKDEEVSEGQQFPEVRKSQHSSGIPTCAFVNSHVKMGLL